MYISIWSFSLPRIPKYKKREQYLLYCFSWQLVSLLFIQSMALWAPTIYQSLFKAPGIQWDIPASWSIHSAGEATPETRSRSRCNVSVLDNVSGKKRKMRQRKGIGWGRMWNFTEGQGMTLWTVAFEQRLEGSEEWALQKSGKEPSRRKEQQVTGLWGGGRVRGMWLEWSELGRSSRRRWDREVEGSQTM